jgi:hypothetical protein
VLLTAWLEWIDWIDQDATQGQEDEQTDGQKGATRVGGKIDSLHSLSRPLHSRPDDSNLSMLRLIQIAMSFARRKE